MEHVNLFGEKVDTTPVKAAKKTAAPTGSYHKGWIAVGYKRETIDNARANWGNKGERGEFNLDNYIRMNKPDKIRVKPFFSSEAANEACRLAEKDGWVGCHAQEKSKT